MDKSRLGSGPTKTCSDHPRCPDVSHMALHGESGSKMKVKARAKEDEDEDKR